MQKNSIIIYILVLFSIFTSSYGQTETPQLYSPTQVKADMDTLITKLIACHPTFYGYYLKHNIQNKMDSIKSQINTPVSALDLFRIMQPVICIDGHTTLSYNGEIYPKTDAPFFPFKVVIYNNDLYVKQNLSDNQTITKGAIIKAINGVPAKTVIQKLVQYLPGEKETYKTRSLESQFHIFYRLVYGSCSEFTVTVNNENITVQGANGNAFQEPAGEKFALRFYDDDIAYIYKRSFKPPKDFINFMDSAFSVIAEKQVKHLVIDNQRGGGLTDLADSLLNYFAPKPYCLFEKKMTKISPMTKDFLEGKKSEGTSKDGFFIQEFAPHPVGYKHKYVGKTYILAGPLSYSTGTCFPAAAKCYGAATIVGQETGQPLLSNGDLNRFILPNTQLACFTSLSRIYMPCNNGDEYHGVLPDYAVSPTLDDMLNDRDYILEYALRLIREGVK